VVCPFRCTVEYWSVCLTGGNCVDDRYNKCRELESPNISIWRKCHIIGPWSSSGTHPEYLHAPLCVLAMHATHYLRHSTYTGERPTRTRSLGGRFWKVVDMKVAGPKQVRGVRGKRMGASFMRMFFYRGLGRVVRVHERTPMMAPKVISPQFNVVATPRASMLSSHPTGG
jgi:hypothetical protein